MTPRPPTNDAATTRRTVERSRLTRILLTTFATGLAATSLTGCVFSYDAPKTTIGFFNESDQNVVFFIETPNVKIARPVEIGGYNSEALDNCRGTAMRVESEDGEVLARIEEAACPNWDLTYNADGTLDYSEQ